MHNKPSVKVGDVFTNNQGSEFTVVEYTNANNLVVEFNDKNMYQCDASVGQIKRGVIKNKYFPNVHGIGYIGEGEYTTKSIAYKTWINGLRDGFIKEGEILCNFQEFGKWADENYFGKGWVLYKGLTKDKNGSYDICLIPRRVSFAMATNGATDGGYLMGVHKSNETTTKPYYSCIRKNYKKYYLGAFDTQEEAHEAYVRAKEGYVKELALEYKEQLADNVFDALMKWKVDGGSSV